MFKVQVTGKPNSFQMVAPREGSKTVATFSLIEKRYIDGRLWDVNWTICVPAHKAKWAEKLTEKGYTVLVEGDDYHVQQDTTGQGKPPMHLLMMTELHSL